MDTNNQDFYDTGLEPLARIRLATRSLFDSPLEGVELSGPVSVLQSVFAEMTGFNSYLDQMTVGRTETANGVAISPSGAARCIHQHTRTVQYLRGVYKAILAKRKEISDRPVQVFYAGCGPYATLAVPILSVLSAAEVQYSILDIHKHSLDMASSMIDDLGLSHGVREFIQADAAEYRFESGKEPDIIISEVMCNALSNEPQVAVSSNLALQAPEATLLPEEIRLDLELLHLKGHRKTSMSTPGSLTPYQRSPKGTLFVLDRGNIEVWGELGEASELPAAIIEDSRFTDPEWRPFLFTRIIVFDDIELRDFQSELNLPLIVTDWEDTPQTDTVEFFYELGQFPKINFRLPEHAEKA